MAVGELDKIKQVVYLKGYVNSAGGLPEQTCVVNGACEFLIAVFGEKGKHQRGLEKQENLTTSGRTKLITSELLIS